MRHLQAQIHVLYKFNHTTTRYAMTKYLGKEISNLVLLPYDKASYTSALLSIFFFKACVI